MNARMTQEDAAVAIGCSRKWVSRFERGLSVPNFENVIAYAAMFGIGVYMDTNGRIADLDHPSRVNSKVE
jgi:DNA-binding XRE family transcriptional regulator